MAKEEVKKDEAPTVPRKKGMDYSNVVRIMKHGLDGRKKIAQALLGVKGLGHNLATSIVRVSGLPEDKRIGDLSEAEIAKLETIVENPSKYGIADFMLNRQNDYTSGETSHLTGADIDMKKRDDVNRLRKIRSYRGIRHELGLPMRGQRTRSSFRKGATMGVKRRPDAKSGK